MSSVIAYLLSKPKSRLLRDGLAIIGLLYLLGRLRKLKLSNLIKAIPGAQGALDRTLNAEVTKAVAGQFPKELVAKGGIRIPENGFTASQLLDQMRTFQKFDADGHGRTFAYVYDTDMKEHSTLIEKAFTQFMHENALNPIAFPALRKFEVEVVQMTLSMLNAPLGACGTMTSGGTESILCALKAYRDRARDKYAGIDKPEVVIPQTGHVAFPKGMHMFGLTPVWVPVGDDFRPDLKAYRAAINKNTVLLVASAPQYPHGVVDPIPEISQLAEEFKLPLHVDACIGGFLLPWVEKLGYPVPTWDFRNAGVTSISADLHKYGYSAKGGSVLSWRYESDRKYQFYAFTEWPGGLFVSPSMLGTRAGGSIAAAWASLNGLGEKGFLKLSDKIMKTATKLKNGINAIPGLKILGNPHMGIISIGSSNPELNILCVADVMEKDYEWHIERQQKPDCLHLTLMPPHSNTADQFLKDIALSVDKALKTPSLKEAGSAAMYGAVAKIPDNVLIENFLTMWMGQVYNPTAGSADKKPESKQAE